MATVNNHLSVWTPMPSTPSSLAALNQDYQNAGFGAALAFGTRPVLLVVDVVQAYLDPVSPLFGQRFVDSLDANRCLVDAARKAKVPVVFTCVAYTKDGRNGGRFFQKVPALCCFVQGSPLGRFAPGLEPHGAEVVVVKQYASAFFGTSLASTLNAMRVDTVLVTGFSTSGCVRATALDALQHGFTPFVVREACADRDAGPHESNLFDLQSKYAEVISLQRALTEIRDLTSCVQDLPRD